MKKYTVYSRQYSGLSNKKLHIIYRYIFLIFVSTVCCLLSSVFADDNPLNNMREETVSYFKPLTGKIIMKEDRKATINIGAKDSVKTGMRLAILREEAPFRHPVTKEPLGKAEALAGKLEIKEVSTDSATGTIIEGDAREGDKVRISELPVNILFCQAKNTDWQLSDTYYRQLKESGRFNIIDTSIETDNPLQIIEEAKRLHADVALFLTSRKDNSGTLLTQRLFWVSDGLNFSEMNSNIGGSFAKELKFGEKFLALQKETAFLQIDVPISAKLMTMADVDGDGKQEIVFSNGKDIRIYSLGGDLQPALGGITIKGKSSDHHLWIDSIDLDKNGKDEIIITSMKGANIISDDFGTTEKGDGIVSSVYELKGGEFVLLYKDMLFFRKLGNGLIAQAYSRTEGFEGNVFSILWEGGYKKGVPVKLPAGVNIYDFVYFDDPQRGRLIMAYDEDGFLNVYDDNGIRLWRSKNSSGGFLTTFKKAASTVMVDRGEWAIKDRLFVKNRDVLSVKRIPLFKTIKLAGYKSSQIRNLRWNGFSVDEGVFIDDISGTLLDYAIAGDKIIILSSPPLGIRPKNILKGENPIKTELSIYINEGL